MLVVLVGLNSDARKRCVAGNIIRFAQIAVSGGKSSVEQLQQVYLAAGGRQGQEVQVVDMDIAVDVRMRVPRVEDVHLVELLCTLAAVFQHGSHCGVAVDIGVFALDIAVGSGFERQILIYLHQGGVHLACPGAVCAVEDIRLCSLGMSLFDQHFLYHILYFFYGRVAPDYLF